MRRGNLSVFDATRVITSLTAVPRMVSLCLNGSEVLLERVTSEQMHKSATSLLGSKFR